MTNKYDVQKSLVKKLSRRQVFWLTVLFLIVVMVVAALAPAALVGVL